MFLQRQIYHAINLKWKRAKYNSQKKKFLRAGRTKGFVSSFKLSTKSHLRYIVVLTIVFMTVMCNLEKITR